MGELFGGQGPGDEMWQAPGGGQPAPGQGEGGGELPNSFVEIDNVTGEMIITLPPRFARYQRELYEDLMDEFYLMSPDNKGNTSVNQFIREWLERKQREEEA